MFSIIDKLHSDHINFSKLLEYLSEELEHLRKCEPSDLELTLNAIRYIKEYPDLVHHPLENVVFKYFLEHYEAVHSEIEHLLHQHAEMPELTNKLFEMLQGALADEPQSRDDLCRVLSEYLETQQEHMNQEEALVFPTIQSTFTKEDWDNIDSELSEVKDPLFGTKVEKPYQDLFQQIIS